MGWVPIRRSAGSRGSALVEMALVAPFLIVLIFGVIDTAWLLADLNEVRHAAREGGRQAAVNAGDANFVVAMACQAMDDSTATTVSIDGAGGSLGNDLEVTVNKQVDTLVGLTDWAFNPPVDLHSTSTFRIEQTPVMWSDVTGQACP